MHILHDKLKFGTADSVLAAHFDCCTKSVSHYISIYNEKGIAGLKHYGYGTNKSDLEVHSASILLSFTEKPPFSIKEAKSRIYKMTGIERSPTQIGAFMKRHGLKYIKLGHIPSKADAEKQQDWLTTTFEPELEKAKKGECVLFFMDAAHFVLGAFLCAVWSKVRLFVRSSAGRNRINVLGAVNAITKAVITLQNTTYVNAQTIVEFLGVLRSQIPLEKPISIVCDNARYQHCNFVIQKANDLNIKFLFLPSYSPNLNIIERFWKFTRKERLYGQYFETPKLFHEAITDFMHNVNGKYAQQLNSLFTLNFQLFDKVKMYPN
jgi:transposase